MEKKIHAILSAVVQYAEEECKIWLRRVPKSHTNRELVAAVQMTRRIEKAKKWLEENDPILDFIKDKKKEIEKGDREMINTIIRAPEGTDRREVEVDKIKVPDLWHVAVYLQDKDNTQWATQILDCWHLAHDLITNIQAHNNNIKL